MVPFKKRLGHSRKKKPHLKDAWVIQLNYLSDCQLHTKSYLYQVFSLNIPSLGFFPAPGEARMEGRTCAIQILTQLSLRRHLSPACPTGMISLKRGDLQMFPSANPIIIPNWQQHRSPAREEANGSREAAPSPPRCNTAI